MTLILTSEHGGNQIPTKFRHLFKGHDELLASHKGYDWGTEDLYEHLLPLASFGLKNTYSRLLIEFNRSEWSSNLFSSITKSLSNEEKEVLLKEYYRPYRKAISQVIEDELKRNNWVLHISLHSFTPVLGSEIRNNDFGLLYDPGRIYEKKWSQKFRQRLKENLMDHTIRMNYPYLGKADGLTSYFRKKYSGRYLGIELEINQKWTENNRFPEVIKQELYRTLSQSLQDF